MKKFITCSTCFIAVFSAFAQFEISVTAEQVVIPSNHYQALDNIMGGSGPIACYRLYAEFPDGFQLSSIYGASSENAAFNISSGNTFYQNPNGAAIAFDIVDLSADPLLAYDSWFTIGVQDSALASEYTSTFALELFPFFENFELGYDVAVDENSMLPSEAALFVSIDFDQNGQLATDMNQPDANGRVLIGQFTTRQFVSGCFSFSLNDIVMGTTEQVNQTVCFSFSPSFVSADFNQDGFVDMTDLSIILEDFGCSAGCNADLNGDNMVTVDDMMSFIYFWSLYGEVN